MTTLEDLEKRLEKVERDIEVLRTQKVSNSQDGAVTFGSLRIAGKPRGHFFEITVDDSDGALAQLRLVDVGTKGI